MTRKISVVVAISGRYVKTEPFLVQLLRAAQGAPAGFEFIFVLDGPQWATLPSVQRAHLSQGNVKVEWLEAETSLPAALFNRGLARAAGDHVIFCDPESGWSERIAWNLGQAVRTGGPAECAYVGSRELIARYKLPHDPTPGLLFDWLLYGPVVPLSNFAVPRQLAVDLGGFDTSPLLQASSGWEFLLRLTRITFCKLAGMDDEQSSARLPTSSTGVHCRVFTVGEDIVRRYAVRSKQLPPSAPLQSGEICADPSFLDDLPSELACFLRRQHARFGAGHSYDERGVVAEGTQLRPPLRLTITGGPWEYHHNWLCFYNYLDHLQGTGFATYQVLLDTAVDRYDLIGSDLVLISRGRSENVREIINACRDRDIPVVYMIDDNWLWVGKDWPEAYGEMFSPGSPSYDNFIYAIRRCDAVLTYNPLLAEDVAAYAREVVTLPNSVDLARFEATPRPERSRFVVGYAGSARYADAPFEALAEIGRRSDVDILLMGDVQDRIVRKLAHCRLIRKPHQSYEQYLKSLRTVGADVLIAPLDDTRTSRSKCPNKFLEITAAGAVGVYSAVEPYVWHIQDGVNGRLVENSEDPAEWSRAVESILDRAELARMHTAARAIVSVSNDVPIVAEQFKDLLLTLVERGSRARSAQSGGPGNRSRIN